MLCVLRAVFLTPRREPSCVWRRCPCPGRADRAPQRLPPLAGHVTPSHPRAIDPPAAAHHSRTTSGGAAIPHDRQSAARASIPIPARRAPFRVWLLAATLCCGAVLAADGGSILLMTEAARKEVIRIKKKLQAEKDSKLIDMMRKHSDQQDRDERLLESGLLWGEVEVFGRSAQPQAGHRERALAVTAPAALTVGSFTPAAAFRGNQTLVIGGLLQPSPARGESVLVRESGCLLSQHAYRDLYAETEVAVPVMSGVEAHFRKMAGLPALPATYPQGCIERSLGIPSSNSALLGQTSNGDTLFAIVDETANLYPLIVQRIAATGAVVGTQTLTAGVVQGNYDDLSPVFAVADLNGDGLADVVKPFWRAPDGSAGVAVFLSQASGSYVQPTTVYPYHHPVNGAAVRGFSTRVSIEDVDGDGKLDIVAQGDGALMTLRGDGLGGFTSGPTTAGVDGGIGPYVVADFNGDGRRDVLSAEGWFFAGAGDGSFAPPVLRLDATAASDSFTHVAAGDFNADGKLDVAVLSSFSRSSGRFVSIFLGGGDGTFSAGRRYSAVAKASEVAVADLDGDGVPDLWVGKADRGSYAAGRRTSSLMQALLGKGDGSFVGAAALPASGRVSGQPSFALADFNGDGRPDVISVPLAPNATNVPVQLQVAAGSAGGDFGAPTAGPLLSFTPTLLTRGDFNGDGKADLVAAFGKVAVLLGQGDGSFGAEQSVALPAGGVEAKSIAVGDVNGDGRSDVVVGTAAGVFVYYAAANGSLQAPVFVDGLVNARALTVGDLDRDGRADIVAPGAGIYRGRADGSFGTPSTTSPLGVTAIADMNKDGKPDLVTSGVVDGKMALTVLPGLGDGSFGAGTTFKLKSGTSFIAFITVADFTFDGNPDVMLGSDGEETEVLVGDGAGGFIAETTLAVAGSASYAAAAQLNSDAAPDAVLAVGQGAIVSLLRTRQALTADAPPSAEPPFTVSASSTSGSVASGAAVQTTMTFAFPTGFADTVALSCGGLPAHATCTFAPASVVPSGGAASSLLTIRTGVQSAAASGFPGGDAGAGAPPLLAGALALLLVLGGTAVPGAVSCAEGWRRRWRAGAGLGAVVVLGLAAGCGGGSSDPAPPVDPPAITPSGTYDVVVTAASPGGSQSLTFRLTVQ